MYDVPKLYDDLVAIRRAAQVLPKSASQETKTDLKCVLSRIAGKLIIALSLLTEDELEETLEALDSEYNNEARADLEALM